jgi:hypothetical protein
MLEVFASFFLKHSTRFFTSFPHQSSLSFSCLAPLLLFSFLPKHHQPQALPFAFIQISRKVAWVFLFNEGSVGYHAICRSAAPWLHGSMAEWQRLGCNAWLVLQRHLHYPRNACGNLYLILYINVYTTQGKSINKHTYFKS